MTSLDLASNGMEKVIGIDMLPALVDLNFGKSTAF